MAIFFPVIILKSQHNMKAALYIETERAWDLILYDFTKSIMPVSINMLH